MTDHYLIVTGEWMRVIDVVAGHAGHVALLDSIRNDPPKQYGLAIIATRLANPMQRRHMKLFHGEWFRCHRRDARRFVSAATDYATELSIKWTTAGIFLLDKYKEEMR